MKKILFPVLAVVALAASGVQSVQRAIVEPFYAFLSNPTSEAHALAARDAMADGWVSIGDYSGAKKTEDKFISQIGGFGKLVPDMNWDMVEVIEAGDKVIVRHLYIERRLDPLNLYFQYASEDQKENAVIGFGNALKEMAAARDPRPGARKAFDKAFFGHLGYMISNMVRALMLGLSSGYGEV